MTQLSDADVDALLHDWSVWGRPCVRHPDGTYGGQQPPPGDWRLWLLMAGRGYGKSRTGAEYIRSRVEPGIYGHVALIGATAADVRDTMVEAIRSASPNALLPEYQASRRRLYWPHNGAVAMMYSAEEPDRLRGPNHDGGWADELAAWQYMAAFDMFLLGLRAGPDPRAVITTTPRPLPIIKALLKDATVVVTTGNTYENEANLAPAFIAQVVRRYEGTRLGQQELYAQILSDTPGALWTRDLLEETRMTRYPPLVRVVVAVDPEAASDEGSAETGIVVAGVGRDGHAYVLADASLRGTPDTWGRAAVTAYQTWHADRLCGEVNNGGDMVGHVIATVDPTVAFKALHASRGKTARAEPVAALWEQGRAHLVGYFGDLEDQLTGWVAGVGKSPDRLDALVWALTELVLNSAHSEIAVAVSSTPEEREDAESIARARVLQRVARLYLGEEPDEGDDTLPANTPPDALYGARDAVAVPDASQGLDDANAQLARLWLATARQLEQQREAEARDDAPHLARVRGILESVRRFGG